MLQPLLRLAVRALPGPAATRLTISLANRSIRPPVQAREQAAFAGAERFTYGAGGRLAAWRWGTGPVVVLVHGWGGRAAQMAPIAQALVAAGYAAVAPEVTGHGESAGSSTAWSHFVRDVAAAADALDRPVEAFVGHSAGGLAMTVARRLGRIRARRFVCIAAPSYPYPPVTGVQRRLDPPERVLQRYRRYLAAQLESQWDALEAGAAFQGAGRDLLLVYDHDDRYVAHAQADRIAAVVPEARVVKTAGYSHTRVLAAPETLAAITDFLGPPA